jgi:hypothetical protein
LVSLSAALALLPGSSAAQDQRGALLTGVVVDSARGMPIADAEVSLPDLKRNVVTDSAGRFRIAEIPAGAYHILFHRLGFREADVTFRFAVGDTIDRRIILGATATVLDSVRVHAERSSTIPSFDENRKVGLGHFLTRADLAKAGAARLSTVLSGLPGLGVVSGRAGQGWIVSKHMTPSSCPPLRTLGTRDPQEAPGAACLMGQGVYVPIRSEALSGITPGCYVQVYLDDRLMNNTRPTEPFDVNSLPLDQLEAVEFYSGPAQTPMKYSKLDSRCGVLVLWTRRSP